MEGLNLATLNVQVQATGVEQAQQQVDNLTSSMQQSGNATTQNTGRMRTAFNSLSGSIREGINNTQIFGTSLGQLRSQLSSGQGATALLQGAVAGLTTALMTMATQAITRAISGISQFISQGIELASDLTEIQNVLDAAFGDGAEQVNEWAATTARAFGLTELQAKQFSSTLGAILSGMNITGRQAIIMSEQMAQLVGDMASFYNLDHDVAFEKIKSGLTGETEPLKALGIVMNETNLSAFALEEGLGKAYSKMSESDKVILRYNYLIEQTSLAHGDFSKTADSYANVSAQLSNNVNSLSSKFSEGLLPAITNVKSRINDLLEKLEPVFTIIGKLIGGMLQTLYNLLSPAIELLKMLLAALSPILKILSAMLDKVIELVTFIGTSLSKVVSWFAEKMGFVQESVGETAEYTTEKITEETENALGYVDSAVDKWVDDQSKKYRKKLEERYGDSLGSYTKIEKLTQQFEERRRKSAESYANAYKRAEEDRTRGTVIELNKQYNLYESFYDKLKKLFSGKKSADITGVNGWGNSDKAYATGTSYHTGGWAIVGENGRELLEMPRGSRVYNNRQAENILRNSATNSEGITNNTYNVSINASEVREFMDVVNICSNAKITERMC